MTRRLFSGACAFSVALATALTAVPASAQLSVAEGIHAGELAVPINKSQVLRSDRPYSKALIGNPEIDDEPYALRSFKSPDRGDRRRRWTGRHLAQAPTL